MKTSLITLFSQNGDDNEGCILLLCKNYNFKINASLFNSVSCENITLNISNIKLLNLNYAKLQIIHFVNAKTMQTLAKLLKFCDTSTCW